ncbi:hypothetical protein Cst04h_15840 [Corynebacterium striatum]|uniref:Transposase n=1 Tax=Corynebacterium striatum TaxID=43770 RepID=A0ABC9ZMK9_CORST|nr:hypothetical protein Cst04h_15840 [Corynebacterium striatum]
MARNHAVGGHGNGVSLLQVANKFIEGLKYAVHALRVTKETFVTRIPRGTLDKNLKFDLKLA